ncbi:MAG: hypothetical protein R6W68_07935 [Ignavibacteriaceae bacterium]
MLTVILSSCSADLTLQRESRLAKVSSVDTKYSIVFVIHGDNNYLYHDSSGNSYKANEEALAGAIRVAEENSQAEVFIFHQKPGSNFFFFFPVKDGEYLYYRNGRLIENESYWRDQKQADFDIETGIYNQLRLTNQNNLIRMFAYLGHEIPEINGAGYDLSYPDRAFTIDNVAKGLKGFTSDFSEFDLVILSTCYGGTPYTIGKLGTFTKTIIASPENLHLSYFDISTLERLDINFIDGDVPAFAIKFAQQSFDKLTRDLQTEVSVAVYDIKSVQEFLNSVNNEYNNKLISLKGRTLSNLAAMERCDCIEIPAYQLSTINEGVEVFYRSARFGRLKNKESHSGWECWK